MPPWVPPVGQCGGHTRDAVLCLVVGAIEVAHGTLPNPERCGTSARPVLALWKRLGFPDPDEFGAELALVIRWAQSSPDGLAENDIRGVRPTGERWGTDRSRDLTTLCVQDRWDARLDAARRWSSAGEHAAAPTTADTGAAEAWTTFERMAQAWTRGDALPVATSDYEAGVLEVFARAVGWGRWAERTRETRPRIREAFMGSWSVADARVAAK